MLGPANGGEAAKAASHPSAQALIEGEGDLLLHMPGFILHVKYVKHLGWRAVSTVMHGGHGSAPGA